MIFTSKITSKILNNIHDISSGIQGSHHRDVVCGPGKCRDKAVTSHGASPHQNPVDPPHPSVFLHLHSPLAVRSGRAAHQLHRLTRHVSVNDIMSSSEVVHEDVPELGAVLHLRGVERQLSHFSAHSPGLSRKKNQ